MRVNTARKRNWLSKRFETLWWNEQSCFELLCNANIWLWRTRIRRINVLDDNDATYEYTRDYAGDVCEEDQCSIYVEPHFYGPQNNHFDTRDIEMHFTEDEQIPLQVEYLASEIDSYETIERANRDDVEDNGFDVYVDDARLTWSHGRFCEEQAILDRIVYESSADHPVYEETVERDICLDENGWDWATSEYVIVDANGEVFMEFSAGELAKYGTRIPYQVTLEQDDVEILYEKAP